MKITTFKYINAHFPKESENEKNNTMDVVILINDIIIVDIEANSSYYKTLHERNFSYATTIFNTYVVSTNKKVAKKTILIDFTRGLTKYKDVKNVSLMQTRNYVSYLQNFVNIVFNIDYALNFWYIDDEKGIKDNFYIIMLALGNKDLEKLSNLSYLEEEDKYYLKKFWKEVKAMNEDRDLKMWEAKQKIYEADIQMQIIDAKNDARNDAIEETKIDNALRMLRDNVNPELVHRYVDLPLNKIKELQGILVTN